MKALRTLTTEYPALRRPEGSREMNKIVKLLGREVPGSGGFKVWHFVAWSAFTVASSMAVSYLAATAKIAQLLGC